MKICLIGYGRMGHEIERVAIHRGHEIVGRMDEGWSELPDCDVAIEFSQPESAFDNILNALKQGVPVVSGTTGWLSRWPEAIAAVKRYDGSFFYSSNYSVGVYLLRLLNKQLAEIMSQFPAYDVSVEEIHHIHKLDYPSGTALTLADDLIASYPRKKETLAYLVPNAVPAHQPEDLLIRSIRESEVPGTHTVRYESAEDILEIKHIAKGREGLALGAVLAGEFLIGKKGLFGMEDLIKLG